MLHTPPGQEDPKVQNVSFGYHHYVACAKQIAWMKIQAMNFIGIVIYSDQSQRRSFLLKNSLYGYGHFAKGGYHLCLKYNGIIMNMAKKEDIKLRIFYPQIVCERKL